MSKWEGTGLYATESERAEVAAIQENIRNLPVVKFSIDGETLPEMGKRNLYALCRRIAVDHGLPDRAEFYGVDSNTGQILK